MMHKTKQQRILKVLAANVGNTQMPQNDAIKQHYLDAAGNVDGTSQIHSFATQCLHNTVFLCDQALPQPTDHSSSSNHAPETGLPRPPDTTAESPEALPNPSGGLSHPSSTAANPSGGPGYPSNGHRGRLGSTQEGSAAEAAEQLAMMSLDRSRASSGEIMLSRRTIQFLG